MMTRLVENIQTERKAAGNLVKANLDDTRAHHARSSGFGIHIAAERKRPWKS